MAQSKFNVLHWHLVDDTSFPYQSVRYSNLSLYGSYLSPNGAFYNHVYSIPDIINLVVAYGQDRGVRVIPEFDTPSHTESWGYGYPNLLTECYQNGKPDGTRYGMNPIQQYTYDFLQNLYQELNTVFMDPYVHVGGDELSFYCWQSNPAIQQFMKQNGWSDYSLLEQYYEKNLLKILEQMGKSYIVWEDVFDNGVVLQQNSVIDVWRGGWQSTLALSTAAGYQSILSSPWYLNYISYGADWTNYYGVEPTNFTGTPAQKALVVGGECCFWGEFIDATNLLARAWPRASAIAERLWSSIDTTDQTDAARRINDLRCRYVRRGIPAEPPNGSGFCIEEWQHVD